MKKFLVAILAVAMMLALAACGGSKEQETTPAGSGNQGGAADSGIPKMEIVIAMAQSENSNEAQNFQVLMDYVKEKSGGNITFKVHYNGEFCAQQEQMDYIKDGSIDLHYNLVAQNPQKNIVRQAFGNTTANDNVNEMFDLITKENPETAAIIDKEAAENNVKILGVWNGGSTVFLSTKPLTSLEDLRGTSYGADMGTEAVAALGVSTQSVLLADIYESLSRGVISSTSITLPGAIAMKFYEVAPHVLYLTMAAPSHQLEMNLDTWNALGEEGQQIFMEAVKKSEDANLERLVAMEQGMLQTMRDAGCTVTEPGEADKMEYLTNVYQQKYNTFYPMAQQAGKGDEFLAILDACCEFNGITIQK
ncbi:MAG: TRAP transporter substrate-binding protein DctP [Lachnospiraceae bacterium]|nr:TRAP transporter substrate-binding protein DctP [Lachnospiraceae bacterium]